MSSFVYPSNLPGLTFGVIRSPIYKTGIQEAVSGKESRLAYQYYPRIKFNLQYELLRDDYTQVNYCLWSEDLTNAAWSKNATGTGVTPTITANYSQAPDGTYTADRVLMNKGVGITSSDLSQIYQGFSVSVGIVVAASIWMKTNDGSTITIILNCGPAGILATVTPTWQRFSASGVSAGGCYINPILIGGSGTSNTADLSMWGAQFEYGSYASTYIQTTTVPIGGSEFRAVEGLFESMQGAFDTFLFQDPDFNTVVAEQFGTGDSVTTAFQLTAQFKRTGGPGWPNLIQNLNGTPLIYRNDWQANQLLYSVPRTNYIIQSENISVTWVANACTVTGPAASPRGDSTAYLINENTATTPHYISGLQLTAQLGVTCTYSVWVKGATRTFGWLQLTESAGGTSVTVYYTLTGSGSVGASTAGANWSGVGANIAAYPSGWYRISVIATKASSSASITAYCGPAIGSTAGSSTYAGTVGQGIYAWGHQLELNSLISGYLPTAYIPTTTATASITDYTLGATGIITLAVAPVGGAPMTWTGSFYYRCRFTEDSMDFVKHANKWWEADAVEFVSIKL